MNYMRMVTLVVAGVLTFAGTNANGQAKLGTLEFANSGAAAAQDAFLKGVLLLHSFEFDDSAIAFRDAQSKDPNFALAYWGEAMTYNHPLWYQQDRDAALAALGRLGSTPIERAAKAKMQIEKDFLAAVETLYGTGDKQQRNLAYMDAMRRMYEKYPGNQEAATFYALSILGSSADGRDFATYMRAAAIASEVYAVNPNHPGAAHYIIHSFDDPIHAPLGLPAARKYSEIAPDASHALHMPSHIFVALGMWEDVARMNVASWQAGVKRVERDKLPIEQNQYHAALWELYARLQLGQFAKAKALVMMVADHQKQSDAGNIKYHLAMMRSAYLVEADPSDTDVLAVTIDPAGLSELAAAAQLFAEAQSMLLDGGVDAATSYLERIKILRRAASVKSENAEPAAVGRTRNAFVSTLVIEKELEARLLAARGEPQQSVAMLREAVEMEDGLTFSFGPPAIVKPSAELLGEFLLQMGDVSGAIVSFERSLDRAPGRSLSVLGLARAAKLAGNMEMAREEASRFDENWRNADTPVSVLE